MLPFPGPRRSGPSERLPAQGFPDIVDRLASRSSKTPLLPQHQRRALTTTIDTRRPPECWDCHHAIPGVSGASMLKRSRDVTAVTWAGSMAVVRATRPSDPPGDPALSLPSQLGCRGAAVSRQLQVRPPNGFGAGPVKLGSALAGAAPATEEPRTIAAPISVFAIRTVGSTFCNPRAGRFKISD